MKQVSKANESSVPLKITGLNITEVGQNFVKLGWDELKDKDFSHYVVYREDASPIAITKPANFNLFIDALVDSGRRYTYQVSAINIFGNEGPKSDPITVATWKGGAALNLRYPEVDIFEDFRKPVLVLNGSGGFNFWLKLNKGDGNYFIKLIFEDRAENTVIIEKSVTLDTKKPEVKIISPPSGAFIFENVANEVDVIGKTKPDARVHLFVDRTPFSFFNATLELSGLPNEVQNIPEAELDAKCRFNVAATSFCRTGADFSVTADSEGNFKFEKVDLTAIFGGAARIREVPVTEFRDTRLEEGKDAKTTTFVVISTDQVGQRGVATQNVRIGTCWSGNQSWDIVPLTEHQRPVFISTERLAEGTEILNFYFKYSYVGRGTNAKITDVSLTKACSTREIIDPRFNISCQILPSGGSAKLSSDKVYSYSSVPISRFPGMDGFLESDWKNFFKTINKELTFPFKVRIRYEHEVIDENGQSSKVTETQTTCEQVSYVVDNSIIDPRKVLPDWLLFDFVDFLQSSIKSLTQLQEQIDKLIDFVAVGCLVSFGAHLVFRIYRIWVEFADETLFKLKAGEILQFKLDTGAKSDNCKAIAEAVQNSYGLSSIRSLKLRYFSDADLKECFPASYAAWQTEANMYQLQRWSCDRIFGHAAPSGWTETESDDELHRAITSEKTCASDLDTRGQRLRVENCKDIAEKFIDIIQAKKDIPQDKKCFLVNLDPKNTQKQFIYTFADDQDTALASNSIYKLTSFERNFIPGKRDIYAIKISENLYMTHQPQTCEQLCGVQPDAKQSQISVNGQPYIFAQGKQTVLKKVEDKQAGEKPTQTTIAGCVTVSQCREWNIKADSKAEGIVVPGIGLENNVLKGYTIQRKGYTNDCFFDENPNNINVVSATDPNLRKECCCVNGKSSPFKELYYTPKEPDAKLPPEFQKPVHQSKTKLGEPPDDYADMEWSYRYSKIGYLSKKYNPNRYIEGRDKPACFGQNNLFYQIFGKEKELLVVDPFKQDTATLQCLFLTGINQRLQLIKNIMSAMSTCLVQVRSTGRADTSVCKELFTQHLCGLIWQGIRWFVDGCTPEDSAFEAGDKEERFVDTLRVGVKGITKGISEMQQEISEEYGNAKLNDLLGAGEESVARKVCLAAFGYDWEINARNLVDAAYSAPFATLVQAVTRSREFLTIDPVSLRSKHEYRASWIINPGCDLERYDIQLACVSRKELDEYPNQISCGSLGAPSIAYVGRTPFTGPSTGFSNCDCLELPQEQTTPFFSESRLKQNSLVDKNHRKPVESDRRYDHLKFILRTDRKIPANAKSNCFPTGYEKGVFYFPLIDKTPMDIADCRVDITLGLFTCSGGVEFFNRKGIAELIEVTINGENADKVKELSIGDRLIVGAKVRKTGKDKCIRISVPSDPIEPKYDGITQNGSPDIAPILITDSLRIAGRTGQVISRGITFSLLAQNNQEPVVINVRAFDNKDNNKLGYKVNNEKIYTEDDRVMIDGNEIDFTRQGEELEYGQTKIKVIGKTITIEKESAKIEIRDIQYVQIQSGSYEYQDSITINPPQQTTQTSQQKTILVELLHLKEDRDSYDNNPDNCNPNDKIIERKYTITVSQQKGVEASSLAPLIQITKPASNAKIVTGKPVEVLSRITHKTGIKKAELVIKDSSGKEVFQPIELPRDGDNFYYNFDTSGSGKGKYFGNIKAESRAETKSDKSFQFELVEPK